MAVTDHPQVMLLTYLCLSCFVFGAFGYEVKEVCYGQDFYIYPAFNEKLYFTPKDGNERMVVVENGTAKDPRFKVKMFSVTLKDVNGKDEGTFSQPSGDLVRLKVLECAEKVERWYDSSFRRALHTHWEFVEFYSIKTPYVREVLLNRSDPSTHNSGRMHLKDGGLQMLHLAQPDDGYYHIRSKDKLLSRINLVILIHNRRSEAVDEKDYTIYYPAQFTPWFANFTSDTGVKMLMIDKRWEDDVLLMGRMRPLKDGLRISPVEMADDGYYSFYDENKNLVLFVKLTVNQAQFPVHLLIYISVAVLIIVSCGVCYCVRRRCQNRNMRRRNAAALSTAAATRGFSAPSEQGAVRYSAAPVVSVPTDNKASGASYSGAPTVVSNSSAVEPPDDPPVYSSGSDFLATDPVPTFDLKGVTLPSAPPLSPEVYTSDKLNF